MSFTPREFRDAMGNFATGVCVITANPEGFTPFGMTVNSLASVSLDPALLLWSLQNDSECKAAFDASTKYAVNILADDQKDLSNHYAKKGDHDLVEDHMVIGNSGTPILKNALTSFECKIWARYDGGDHEILVGEITDITTRSDGQPLLFHAGQYGELKA